MKRFVVFYFYDYFPEGGFNDFYTDCESLKEAMEKIKERQKIVTGMDKGSFQIFDLETRILFDKDGNEQPVTSFFLE